MTETPILTRTFEVVDVEADGRNLEILCVPFNSPARVADPPDWTPYLEEFVPGAFEGATRAPNRVYLDFEHQLGISNVLGHGREFEETDTGLLGRFRVDEGPDGDKALRLIGNDVLRGASVMFKPLGKVVKSAAGVVQRTKVHLDRVSLCRIGAYPEAQVLAVRTPAMVQAEQPLPFNPELAEKLGKYVTVPDGLKGTSSSS